MTGKKKLGNKLAVVIVEDDNDTRLYFSDLLDAATDLYCAGSFPNGESALDSVPLVGADLVLMDIHLPGLDGIHYVRRLKLISPKLKVVLMTGSAEAGLAERSRQAGADGFLLKPVAPEQCLAALRFAAADSARKPSEVRQERISPMDCSPASTRLSSREAEVMGYLADGLLYKEIADKMGISFSTVHKYQHQIFVKFSVTNRTEALRKWLNRNRPPS